MVIDMPLHIGLQINARNSEFKYQLIKAKKRITFFKDHINEIPEEGRTETMEMIKNLENLVNNSNEVQRVLNIELQQVWN